MSSIGNIRSYTRDAITAGRRLAETPPNPANAGTDSTRANQAANLAAPLLDTPLGENVARLLRQREAFADASRMMAAADEMVQSILNTD